MPSVTYSTIPLLTRAEMATEQNAVYPISLLEFQTWDALKTNLPAAAANDDLGLVTGTLGTHAPTITAGDVKTTSSTRYARCQVGLPAEYKAGGSVTLRISAGVQTTIADTSCTVDAQVYRVVRDTTVGSDICATTAQSCNSTTFSDKSFTITPTTLNPGDLLDIRVALIYVDGSTATAVTPTIASVDLLIDIRG